MNKVNVLVTGADGFIGSHLVEMLVSKGYQVRALSQYNSFNNWGWLEVINCKDKIEILTGDIRDSHYCRNIMKDVDIVFHLAALIAIPYSYIAPSSYVTPISLEHLTFVKRPRKMEIYALFTLQQVKSMVQHNMCR